MAKNGRAKTTKGSKRDLQTRVRGRDMIEGFLRHLGSIDIDLDEEELELGATFPDDSYGFGTGNYEVGRRLDLEDHPRIRRAVRDLVDLCHEAILRDDPDYDPQRCDRCVKADCCRIERIHLTDDERVAILDHLGLRDTPHNSARFFAEDDDLAGFYRHVMRHDDGHCVFLKKQGRIMRCSIYDARPSVCRDYDAGYCTEYSKLLPAAQPIPV